MALEFGSMSKGEVKAAFGKTEMGEFILAMMDQRKIRKIQTARHDTATNWFAEDMDYVFFRDQDGVKLKQLGTFEVEGEFSGTGGENLKIGYYKIPKDCVLVEYGISFGKFTIAINYFDWTNKINTTTKAKLTIDQ